LDEKLAVQYREEAQVAPGLIRHMLVCTTPTPEEVELGFGSANSLRLTLPQADYGVEFDTTIV